MVLAPVVLVLFALGMERVEAHLRKLTLQQDEVQDFIDTHAPEDPLAPPTPDPLDAPAPASRS